MYTHLDYDKTGHLYTFRLTRLDMYTHLDYVKTGHVYTFRLSRLDIYTHLDCQDWTCIHI